VLFSLEDRDDDVLLPKRLPDVRGRFPKSELRGLFLLKRDAGVVAVGDDDDP